MAEVLELDEKRRVVFPDCFSPGDLFMEKKVSENEVVYQRITEPEEADVPLAKVVRKNGHLMIQAPVDRQKIVQVLREDRDAR